MVLQSHEKPTWCKTPLKVFWVHSTCSTIPHDNRKVELRQGYQSAVFEKKGQRQSHHPAQARLGCLARRGVGLKAPGGKIEYWARGASGLLPRYVASSSTPTLPSS